LINSVDEDFDINVEKGVSNIRMKWLLLGYGDLPEKRVVTALQNANNSELVAVWGRDCGKSKDFSERHEYTNKSLNAGKHVICEKPMALNAEQCKKMINCHENTYIKFKFRPQNSYPAGIVISGALLGVPASARLTIKSNMVNIRFDAKSLSSTQNQRLR
jgi:hypothetical protein